MAVSLPRAEPAFGSGPRLLLAALAALGLAGCAQGGAAPGPGTERGACRPDHTCGDGLECLSDRCVRPPGADCAAIADALTSIDVGNYAPRQQRALRLDTIAALCRAQHVTVDEGACLLSKQDKDGLAECPKPLIVNALTPAERAQKRDAPPGACAEYVRLLERYTSCAALPAASRSALRQTIDQMKQMWKQVGNGPAIETACRQGVDALRQGMSQLGC